MTTRTERESVRQYRGNTPYGLHAELEFGYDDRYDVCDYTRTPKLQCTLWLNEEGRVDYDIRDTAVQRDIDVSRDESGVIFWIVRWDGWIGTTTAHITIQDRELFVKNKEESQQNIDHIVSRIRDGGYSRMIDMRMR